MDTQKLRIIHADTDDMENPLRGGQPVRTYSVCTRLTARHDITVFTSVYKGSRRRVERSGIHYRRLGFRVPGLGLSPHLSFMAALGPAVARTPHDLVVEEFTPPVGFNGLAWWTKAPVVLSVQWFFFEQWERRYHLPFSRWMKRLAKSNRYRHVIVQSDQMRRDLQAFLPQATFRKIGSGVDESAFSTELFLGDYALFLGRIDIEHKGIDLLLEAWGKVCGPRKIPLIIAGEGAARQELEKLVARENLGNLVRFVGRIEGAAKTELIAKSRLLVMPSRYETFGISALEAMAASKPVVCFDIPHLNEIASPPWAAHAPAFDAVAFGQAVTDLWIHPEHCLQMGARAHLQAQSYRWDVIARQQEAFYLEVYNSHRETA